MVHACVSTLIMIYQYVLIVYIFDYIEVARILILDANTIRRYKKQYEKMGVDGLITKQQEMGLIIHLKHHT